MTQNDDFEMRLRFTSHGVRYGAQHTTIGEDDIDALLSGNIVELPIGLEYVLLLRFDVGASSRKKTALNLDALFQPTGSKLQDALQAEERSQLLTPLSKITDSADVAFRTWLNELGYPTAVAHPEIVGWEAGAVLTDDADDIRQAIERGDSHTLRPRRPHPPEKDS